MRVHLPGKIEELSVGDSASVTKRISQADIDAFARISGDDNLAYVDAVGVGVAAGRRVAHGMLTAGLISAVLGTLLPGPGSIYMSQTLRWIAPVWPDDLLTATATVKRDRRGEGPGRARDRRDPRRGAGPDRGGLRHGTAGGVLSSPCGGARGRSGRDRALSRWSAPA